MELRECAVGMAGRGDGGMPPRVLTLQETSGYTMDGHGLEDGTVRPGDVMVPPSVSSFVIGSSSGTGSKIGSDPIYSNHTNSKFRSVA
jgi:hypothetical protein